MSKPFDPRHPGTRNPGTRAHSSRQRTLVLTFDTAADAYAFDVMTLREVVEMLASSVGKAETAEP